MRMSFLPPVVREGDVGPNVNNLQAALNLLPSVLAMLTVDGKFGPKTTARVKEFQRLMRIAVDGDVGPETMGKLTALIPDVTAAVAMYNLRTAVVTVANIERFGLGSLVNAVKAESFTENGSTRKLRRGHARLREYVRLSDPSQVFSRDGIKYLQKVDSLDGCPHWCGIFALWVHKMAGTPNIGTWHIGVGISAVSGFRQLSSTETPMPADIGFVEAKQHHVLIRRAYPKGGSLAFDTVEGNSSPGSVVATREGSLNTRFTAFYRARSLDIK